MRASESGGEEIRLEVLKMRQNLWKVFSMCRETLINTNYSRGLWCEFVFEKL